MKCITVFRFVYRKTLNTVLSNIQTEEKTKTKTADFLPVH